MIGEQTHTLLQLRPRARMSPGVFGRQLVDCRGRGAATTRTDTTGNLAVEPRVRAWCRAFLAPGDGLKLSCSPRTPPRSAGMVIRTLAAASLECSQSKRVEL